MIRFEAVSKYHKGKNNPAVRDLSLHIAQGEICVFIGPSGCGKTTILRMINRLDAQDSGCISVNGTATHEVDVVALRRGIGFMMQNSALFPHKTVAENISAVPRLLGWSQERIQERVRELILLVGLQSELLSRYPNQLSGGQQSRVALARALASDPPVILMDEPFAALDPVIRERLQDELIALQRRLKKTIVLVTHDMEEAIKLGDRIAIFEEEGKLIQMDSPKNILANPSSEFVKRFIGKDPSLKRLTLMKVSELQSRSVALAKAGGVMTEFDRETEIDSKYELLLNERLEPLEWIGETDFPVQKLTLVTGEESLHHALVKILSTPNGIVVRVDEKGKYEGCISISSLYRALNDSRVESMQ